MVHASACKGLFLGESSGKLAMDMVFTMENSSFTYSKTVSRVKSLCVYLIIMLQKRKEEKINKKKTTKRKSKRGSKLQV